MRMKPPTLPIPKRKVYVSAPMAGMFDLGEKMFNLGKSIVHMYGYSPVLPPDLEIPDHPPGIICPTGRSGAKGHNEPCNLKADLKALLDCDAILLMPGWLQSWGCKLEFNTAAVTGMICYLAIGDGPIVSDWTMQCL
jgi:hypothetical protein